MPGNIMQGQKMGQCMKLAPGDHSRSRGREKRRANKPKVRAALEGMGGPGGRCEAGAGETMLDCKQDVLT